MKLKLNQKVTYNGQECIVFSIRNSGEVVLFNLVKREYITVNPEDLK